MFRETPEMARATIADFSRVSKYAKRLHKPDRCPSLCCGTRSSGMECVPLFRTPSNAPTRAALAPVTENLNEEEV